MLGFLAGPLVGPLLGGAALALALGLGASVLHTTGIPFLGLQGLNGRLANAEASRDSCIKDINDPTTGWAVRFKTSQNNETVLKNELNRHNADAEKAKAESDQREADATRRLLAVREQNAGLARQVRAIVSRPQPATGVAKEAVGIVLGSLE